MLPETTDLKCLSLQNTGCPSFTEQSACLSSVDGRGDEIIFGRKAIKTSSYHNTYIYIHI